MWKYSPDLFDKIKNYENVKDLKNDDWNALLTTDGGSKTAVGQGGLDFNHLSDRRSLLWMIKNLAKSNWLC